ncbi:DUF5819 family protein [Streptomyces sp. NPDC057438]|uniref:DUF5819 family protein n=1 Tax=Streptomyces sp. NPDC057438 TaxID=3346133 RepID=UPI003691BDC4
MDANDEVSNARRGPDEPEGSDSASEADARVPRDSRPIPDPANPVPGTADPVLPVTGEPVPSVTAEPVPPVTADPAPASSVQSSPDAAPDTATGLASGLTGGLTGGLTTGPTAVPVSGSAAGSVSALSPDASSDPSQESSPWPRADRAGGPARPAAGIAALTLPYQIAVALVLAVVGVVTCVHLGLVFLHIAPSNTLTKQHGRAVDEWVYPEFEQNWKLFAPNPLQQNIAVQARAQVRTADGETRETGWYDLSALDGAAIDGNPVPSHTQQNELRRAWDFYVSTHDAENRATTSRGDLSQRYVRRIVVMRLDREGAGESGGVIERIQLRSRTTNVPPPEWSEEKVSDKPVVRELPWWQVTDDDRADAAANAGGAGRATTGRTEASAE